MSAQKLSRSFAFLYVLAMFGAFITFVPLAALILPQKIATVDDIAPAGAVRALSWLLVGGGIMAGIGNIIAGHFSDQIFKRTGSRRGLIRIGLFGIIATLAAFGAAKSFAGLMLAMVAFQLALNALLSPLVALLVDYVPDMKKGRMAGWLGLALPVGSLAVSVLVALPAIGTAWQLTLIILVATGLISPLLHYWPAPSEPDDPASTLATADPKVAPPGSLKRDFALAWTSRLLVQFAAATILPYLYYYVADVANPGANPTDVATGVGVLSLTFTGASVGGGLILGWVSDRLKKRGVVLVSSAGMVSVSMLMLATITSWPAIIAAYALFAAGLAGFLAVDSALVAQLLSTSSRRATLLGLMNLTNTLPGVLAPATTLFILGGGSGGAARIVIVLKLAAVSALLAAICGSQIRAGR